MLTGIAHSRSIPVSYSLSANFAPNWLVDEGNSITYTLTTTGLPDGTVVYWDNTGSTVSADFTQGINSGTLTINNNTASIILTIYEDYVTEGTETIVFNVMETQGGTAEVSISHNVNDTTITPGVFRVTVGHTDISCHGALTGELRVDSTTGGNPPYTYTFKQGSQVLQTGSATTLSGLAAGTYTIDVTDTSAGQYVAQTISQNEVILEPLTPITSTHSSTTSSITVDPDGGTAGYTIYLFHHSGTPIAQQTTSGSAVTFTGLSSNTGYEYSITDSAGCSIPNRISINTGATALSASIAKTNVTCAGGSDGQITVNVSSGESPYTYTWNDTGAEGSTAYNLTQGTYSVTVTDNAGQQQSFSEIQITQPDPIELGLVSKTSTSIQISAIGGNGNYTYSGAGQTNSDGNFTGLTPGQSYLFSASDSNGCIVSTDISVTTYNSINAEVSSTFNGCNGDAAGSATVIEQTGGSGEYTYEWSQNTNNYTSNVSINGLVADNYGVRIIDTNDSSNYKDIYFSIIEPSALSSNYSADMNTATVYVGGGTPPYTYIGSETYTQNGGTFNFSGLSAGTNYDFTFEDFHGCRITEYVLTAFPPIEFITFETSSAVCPGDGTNTADITIEWTGGNGEIDVLQLYRNGSLYSSPTNVSSPVIFNNLPAGTYQFGYSLNGVGTWSAGTAWNGDDVVIEYTNWDIASAGKSQSWFQLFVDGSSGGELPIYATVYSPSNSIVYGPFEFYAKGYNQGQPGPDAHHLYATGLNPYTQYRVEFVDANGCTHTVENHQTLTDPEPLNSININVSGNDCWDSGDVGQFYVNPSGGVAPYQMQIYRNGLNYGSIRSTGWVNNLPEGTYKVRVYDSSNQYVDSNTSTYSHKPEPTLSVSSISSNSIVVNVDPGAVLHVNGGTIQTASSPWTIGSLEPNTMYNITSTYDLCTSSVVSATTSCGSISITFSTNQISCNGGTGSIYTQVNGQTDPSGYTYQWYKNGSIMSGRTSYFLSGSDIGPGDYYAMVSSSCDSEQSSTVTLIDPSPLSVLQTGSTTTSITLQVSGGTPSYWVDMNGSTQILNASGQSVTFNGLDEQEDSYNWMVTASGGCMLTGTASKPVLTLYPAYTSAVLSAYQPNGASTFCEITSSANANVYVQVTSENPYQLIGDYIRSSNGTPQTGFAEGEKIAISYTYNMAVPNDGGVWELTFGPNSEIIDVQTLTCGTSNPGGDDPVFRDDPME